MPQRDTVHWYAGPTTFYRAPSIGAEELPEGSTAVLGVPLDSWTLGRNGQRYAPRAIRDASLYLAGYYGLQTEPVGYVNVNTGDVWTVPDRPRLFDVGDVRLHQGDVHAQTEAIAAHVATIVSRGSFPVVLGGDHYVPYPSFLGFVRGLQERKPGAKVGFVNLDGHFDLWDEFRDMGRYNHGTFARRIADHEAVGKMVWWGLNGANIAEPDQIELCRDRGFAAYTTDSIRRRGPRETLREALEIASEGADAVYVTFDIDCTDGAFAPGTHSIVDDGLTAGEVLSALEALPECDLLGAFDVCEMLPQYDVGGGRTARYAAHAILSVVGDRILDRRPVFGRKDLDAVFR
ncbi:agmatinase family protein [Conexibacter arvalis]|uniref:Arginase family enzyme n=1 Tax=Conexibacter arvalis TaxID=912552 RepID=A0A840IDJ3_9ACTN|nr:agmatinase family protein [Conexibacter arvalis]MBB4662010.1 arginase family enzyme [Conexibacter arvalis]